MTDTENIKQGHEVADAAEALRQDLRWTVKPGDSDRDKQITDMLVKIRDAMEPIRSAVGRAVWGQVTASVAEKLSEVSERLQYERKQLKKMRR